MKQVLAGLRPFQKTDIESLVRLLVEAEAWPPSTPPSTEALQRIYGRWSVDPLRDVNVLPGGEGIIAYSRATVISDPRPRLGTAIVVHPSARGEGIGAALYKLIEERAHNAAIAYLTMSLYLLPEQRRVAASDFLEHRGFYADSTYWQMRLDNLRAQPPTRWPEEFTWRNFTDVQRDAERWAELVRENFHEATTGPKVVLQSHEPGASPEGYFFAVEKRSGLEVGTARARIDFLGDTHAGYIGTVGVLPEYRGKGLAQMLLRQTTGYIASKGADWATLFVEDNNHGARRLYEWMGWRPTYRAVHYWKHLTPPAPKMEQV